MKFYVKNDEKAQNYVLQVYKDACRSEDREFVDPLFIEEQQDGVTFYDVTPRTPWERVNRRIEFRLRRNGHKHGVHFLKEVVDQPYKGAILQGIVNSKGKVIEFLKDNDFRNSKRIELSFWANVPKDGNIWIQHHAMFNGMRTCLGCGCILKVDITSPEDALEAIEFINNYTNGKFNWCEVTHQCKKSHWKIVPLRIINEELACSS